jgi:acetyl esterase
VPCRLYVPSGAQRMLMFLHGGGFVFGDLDTHDGQSRRLANRTRSAVLTVDYRRPPEHRFPAAPDDVDVALRWLQAHAPELGVDTGKLVVCGDSAGGNLALVVALRNPGALAACVLVYPFIDPDLGSASYAATDGGLTREEAAWYWRQYARGPEDLRDPDLAPYLSDQLGTLPPTLVQIAEHDTLADEDLELVRRISAADGLVEHETYAGMVHGFWRHPDLFDASEEALARIAAFLERYVP